MAERVREPDFAWYRLQGREVAALLFVAAVVAGLALWSSIRARAPHDVPVQTNELPPARVNVNKASAAELTALPGIGEAKSANIVEARKQTPITSLQELAEAAGGIPEDSLKEMKPYVTFE